MKTVYLDNAATTPMRKAVIEAVTQSMETTFGNPSSSHAVGRKAKAVVEQCRKTIAKQLSAKASEIVFTAGGTEANNLILQGAVKQHKCTHIISTKIEHHAVLNTLNYLKTQHDIRVSYLDVNAQGHINLDDLEQLLKQNSKVLVSIMYINNELGTINPIQAIGKLCNTYNALFHTDAVQAFGRYSINVNSLHIDYLSASAHKLHGPKGIGFAYVKQTKPVTPLVHGGEQERGYRSGTQAVNLIAGFNTAVSLAYKHLEEDTKHIQQLKAYAIAQLQQQFPDLISNGAKANSQSSYTILHVGFPSLVNKADSLLFQLDLKGIACSKGSACQSGSQMGSHVLAEILSPEQNNIPSLRFSFSAYNTQADIDYLVQVLSPV